MVSIHSTAEARMAELVTLDNSVAVAPPVVYVKFDLQISFGAQGPTVRGGAAAADPAACSAAGPRDRLSTLFGARCLVLAAGGCDDDRPQLG